MIDYAYAGQIAVYCVIGVVLASSIHHWLTNVPKRDAWTWQREAEAVLEAQTFESWRNRDVTHIDPDYQAFMLDAEPSIWADRRDVA
jgi:hypothetical protein